MSTTQIKVALGLDTSTFAPAALKAEKALQGIGMAGQASARQIAAATRGLPAQFTDIATQLAGGQNPLLVLLQQGGQIKDQFGGIGNAIKGVGAAISPVGLIFGTVAAAAGTFVAAAVAGATEGEKLRDMLVLTGNAAGLTADRLDDLTQSISASSQQTVGDVRDLAVALAATGQTSASVFDGQATAIARLADLTGKAGKDIATSFAGQLAAPARFAAKLNETYNFLSVADFKRIQALEKGRKATEAVNLTNELLYKSLEGQKSQLGAVERAWDSFTKQISRARKALLDFGKPETMQDVIDQQRGQLSALQRQQSGQGRRGTVSRAGLASLVDGEDSAERLRELNRFQSQQIATATAISEAAASTRGKIAELVGAGGGGKPADPINAIRTASQQYRADFLRSEKAGYDEIAKLAEDQAQDDERRTIAHSEFLQGLADANRRAAAELIVDERERGLALIELDRDLAQRRIREAQLSGSQLRDALGQVDEGAAIQQIKLDREIAARVKGAADSTGDRLTDSISTGILEGFRRGGGFADIFLQELKAQFAKTVLAPLIRPVVDAGNGLLGDFLQGIALQFAGRDAGFNPGAADFATGDIIRGRRAAGGRVDPHSSYLVGEQGPEVLRMGAQGGTVVPNHALGGPTLHVINNVTIEARTDAAQVSQVVAAGVQQGMRATMEQLRVMGVTR